MRESIPYKIIGGVRFYERKEIKDSLAYLKLIINPHDDVSLRRVINVPARGVGKGVMDALQAIDPDAVRIADAPPLLAAGLQEVTSARSLWAKLVYAVEDGKLPARAIVVAARVPRPHRRPRARGAAGHRSRSSIGKMLDQTGYLKDLRDENSEEANERIENLMELVSAARDYEAREAEASLGGFVDRLSLLSEADEESGSREARVWMMTMHAAKGLEFPRRRHRRARRGPLPALARRRGRRGDRRRAPPVLRRDDAGAVATWCSRARRGGGCSASTRRPSRHASSTRSRPSSSSASRRRGARPTRAPSATATTSSARTRTGGRAAARSGKPNAAYAYENEDQSAIGLRTGMRVRHPQFGVGTVIAVEEHNDDLKITVRFNRWA